MNLLRSSLEEREQDCENISLIVKEVKSKGDSALLKYARLYDSLEGKGSIEFIRVPIELIERAQSQGESAILSAFENLVAFHEYQIPKPYSLENKEGVTIGAKWQPIKRIGLTIPGGSAPLVSTVLMLGVPAMLAGNNEVALITPAKSAMQVNEDILFAAKICGIKEVYCVGGPQGIAALAYGTESIKRVDKIFGPGSFYVDQAKRIISIDSEGAAIDMPAGPSEVLVIADDVANPRFIASDLLAQLEHGIDSEAILLTTSELLLQKVKQELSLQVETLARKSILKKSLRNTKLLKVESLDEALELSEAYAPEHLIIQTREPEALLDKVSNAGSVFLGPYTPETLGDYLSGTNHVLPTNGFARSRAGLGVTDFMRKITYQKASRESLMRSSEALFTLADMEGLDAHKNAVTQRLEDL